MVVKQVSVFLENKIGRLAEVTKILKESNINLRVAVLSETAEFGIFRMIVNDPDKAYLRLKEANFTVREGSIVAVEVGDKPGVLNSIAELAMKNGLSIEYMYSFVEQNSNQAILFLCFEDFDKGIQALKANGYKLLTAKEIMKI